MGPRKSKRTLAEAGEYVFIERIRGMMPPESGDILRSVGDDCLVVKPPRRSLLMTVDTFVDGVHFDPAFATPHQIGARCMTASVSDIAAMAGFPLYTLVSLSLPPTMLLDDAVALFSGLQETAEYYECPICGGETTSTPGPATITVTVIGKAAAVKPVYRSGAREGDGIYVTGAVGDAMGGLRALQRGIEGYGNLKEKFLSPAARVTLARSLNEIYKITAMIDLSDGLATDLGHICDESGVGAEIDESRLQVSHSLRALCRAQNIPATDFALGAGEDFELLFTASDRSLGESFRFMTTNITRVGRITGPNEGVTIRRTGGAIEPVGMKGYEHFT